MSTKKENLPWLGRQLLWLDRPQATTAILVVLALVCLALFGVDFVYHKHTKLGVEEIPGFYGLFGFVMSSILVVAALILRAVVSRSADYYAPHDVANETFPEDQLNRESNND